jgi:hypothetical protein
MYIASGPYSDYFAFSDDDWIGGTVIGVAVPGSITPASKGQVISMERPGSIP